MSDEPLLVFEDRSRTHLSRLNTADHGIDFASDLVLQGADGIRANPALDVLDYAAVACPKVSLIRRSLTGDHAIGSRAELALQLLGHLRAEISRVSEARDRIVRDFRI